MIGSAVSSALVGASTVPSTALIVVVDVGLSGMYMTDATNPQWSVATLDIGLQQIVYRLRDISHRSRDRTIRRSPRKQTENRPSTRCHRKM